MINLDYKLWPIWTDWLEEQEQETALLKFCLEYCLSYMNNSDFYHYFGSKEHINSAYNGGDISNLTADGDGWQYYIDFPPFHASEKYTGNCFDVEISL